MTAHSDNYDLWHTDLPPSNAADAIGDNSTLMNIWPSVGRLALGSTTSHDTCPKTLKIK